MDKIIQLIPNWDAPAAISGKKGYYIEYYKNTFQGISLAFFMTTYHYDNIYKFETCSPNNNKDIGQTAKEIKDHDAPQSLMFFYKQMDQKRDMAFRYPEHKEENKALDYFISDPFSKRMPSFEEIKNWPLE